MAVISEFVTKRNETLTSLWTCPVEKKTAPQVLLLNLQLLLYNFLLYVFLHTQPDDGYLVQSKCVAFYITILKCCAQTDCFIVMYCINTTGMTHINIKMFNWASEKFMQFALLKSLQKRASSQPCQTRKNKSPTEQRLADFYESNVKCTKPKRRFCE